MTGNFNIKAEISLKLCILSMSAINRYQLRLKVCSSLKLQRSESATNSEAFLIIFWKIHCSFKQRIIPQVFVFSCVGNSQNRRSSISKALWIIWVPVLLAHFICKTCQLTGATVFASKGIWQGVSLRCNSLHFPRFKFISAIPNGNFIFSSTKYFAEIWIKQLEYQLLCSAEAKGFNISGSAGTFYCRQKRVVALPNAETL